MAVKLGALVVQGVCGKQELATSMEIPQALLLLALPGQPD